MSVQAMIVTRKLTRSKKMKDNNDHKSRFCIVKNDKKKMLDYDLSLFYTAYFEKKFTSWESLERLLRCWKYNSSTVSKLLLLFEFLETASGQVSSRF